jgi:hypothetical protein
VGDGAAGTDEEHSSGVPSRAVLGFLIAGYGVLGFVMYLAGLWLLIGVVTAMLSVSLNSFRIAWRERSKPDVNRAKATEVARREARNALGAAAVCVILGVALTHAQAAPVGGVGSAVLATVWVARRHQLAVLKIEGNVRRMLLPTARLREFVEDALTTNGFATSWVIAPDGEPRPPVVVYLALVWVLWAALGTAVGPTPPARAEFAGEVVRVAGELWPWHDEHPDQQRRPEPTGPPVSAAPGATCDLAAARKQLRTVADEKARDPVGDRLFGAWQKAGGEVLGCPGEPPAEVGTLWYVKVTGGSNGVGYVVGDATHAEVVYAAFASLVVDDLDDVAKVEERRSWGTGTMQLLRFHDGSCRLLQTYPGHDADYLPASVTTVLANRARRVGAFPRIDDVEGTTTRTYRVAFVAPTPDGALVRVRAKVVYDAATGTTSGRDATRDTAACPTSVGRLADIADALHRIAHAAPAAPVRMGRD